MPDTAENQTNVNNADAGNGSDIKDIMGGMSDAKPEAEPTGNGGDAAQGKSDAGNGNGAEVQRPAWMSQIGDIAKDEGAADELGQFEKIGDLAKSYLELKGKLGSIIVKPGENASAEEREAFYKSLGKPETADGYGIKGDEAKLFREIAYKNNLTDEQAKAMFASLQEVGKNAALQQKQAFEAMSKSTQKELEEEYGNQYPAKIEMLKRGIKNYGGEKLGAKLQQAGLLADKDVVKLFILLGEQSSEAGAQVKTQGAVDGYKSIADGGTLSFGSLFEKK